MIRIQRILAPTDFSDRAGVAVKYAVELAAKFDAELILLNIIPDTALVLPDAVMPTPMPIADLGQLTVAAKSGLATAVKSLGLEGRKVRQEVRVGSPAGEIIAAARDLNADMVCVGTHGRTGLAHMLLGSTAEKVVRESPCPVLTVRATMPT
jgi:nucleotide-binding universal stress UspA family protein